MKESIYRKLEALKERHEELRVLLSTEDVINNQNRYRTLSKEYAELDPVIEVFNLYLAVSHGHVKRSRCRNARIGRV